MSDQNEITVTGKTGEASPVGAVITEGAGSLFASATELYSAHKQKDWQEYMSNTAHQREVADMRKAGLNPILSAMGGSGATTPVGAMVRPDNPAEGVANTIAQYKMLRSQMNNLHADSRQKVAMANNLIQTTKTSASTQKREDKTTELLDAQIEEVNQKVNTEKVMQSMYSASAQAQLFKNAGLRREADMYNSKVGVAIPYAQSLGQAIQQLTPKIPIRIQKYNYNWE